jgi:hypothetical protein
MKFALNFRLWSSWLPHNLNLADGNGISEELIASIFKVEVYKARSQVAM